LGCVDQPLGQRGDMEHLNLEKNATVLFSSLDEIFSLQNLSPNLRAQRCKAYGYAYWAVGLLAYGSNNLHLARAYLWRALKTEPLLRYQKQIWYTLGKSLLGEQLLQNFKLILSFIKSH